MQVSYNKLSQPISALCSGVTLGEKIGFKVHFKFDCLREKKYATSKFHDNMPAF